MTKPHPKSPDPQAKQLLPAEIAPQRSTQLAPAAVPRAPVPPASNNGITPAFLWRVFCRWWKWVLPAGLTLAALAGAAVWYFWVPKYEAAALIKIQTNPDFIAFEQGHSQGDGDRYVQTQIELLRGPDTLNAALSQPEVASVSELKKQIDPIKYLQEQLSVSQVGKSELYRVALVSPSPQDAAAVVNAIVSQYLASQSEDEKKRVMAVLEVLDVQRGIRKKKVEDLQRRVLELADGRSGVGPGLVIDASALTALSPLYQKKSAAEIDCAVLQSELERLQAAPVPDVATSAVTALVDAEIANRPDVRQLNEHLAELADAMVAVQNKRRTKIGDTWEKDPDYLRLKKLQTEKQAELDTLKIKARREYLELKQAQADADHQRQIAEKAMELAAVKTRLELLQGQYEAQQDEMKSSGQDTTELEFAQAELAREEKVFDLIAERDLALRTEMRAPSRVDNVRPAEVPSVAIEPIPYKYIGIAFLATLFAPFGLAVVHEWISRRVTNVDQLRTELLLPVLGEIARFPTRMVSQAAGAKALPAAKRRELYVYAESIDSLRTNLRLTESVGVPGCHRVIAVCSAASGEGKTSVATALAVSLSEATQQPTLILDADLRDPDVAALLGVPDEPGLAEVLSGEVTAAEAVHQVGHTQTYVMPAGKCRVNPHQLLQGSAIEDLLGELRKRFETIVIDTPPVLAASESLVYAVSADLVIFCSLADVSRCKPVQAAVERLQGTGANLAGAVLNGVTTQRYAYQYGTYARPDQSA